MSTATRPSSPSGSASSRPLTPVSAAPSRPLTPVASHHSPAQSQLTLNATNGRSSPPLGAEYLGEKKPRQTSPADSAAVDIAEQTPKDPAVLPPKTSQKLKLIVKPMVAASVLLLIVLWATALWIFGVNHNGQHRAYKLHIRVRDLDGGVVGSTLLQTLDAMKAPEYPTFDVTQGSVDEVVKSVWDGTYWGAIVVNEESTEALNNALANPEAGYNASAAITNYLTGVRYFTTYSSYIRPALTQALAINGAKMNGYAASVALESPTPSNSSALALVIAQAVSYTEVDLAPLPFQSRVFINTFGVVVPNLATFFFNMIIMGVFNEFGVYSHPTTMFKLSRAKFILKFAWCFLAALIMTSVNLSFREDYTYPAKNFFALWTNTFFYCWINFNIFGTLLAFLPVKFIMYFVFPIIVTSVSAAVFPPEIGDKFYNISYMFPSHAYWVIAITIFGRGACNRLKTYAPVVMAWVIGTELIWLTGDWHLSKKSKEGGAAHMAH